MKKTKTALRIMSQPFGLVNSVSRISASGIETVLGMRRERLAQEWMMELLVAPLEASDDTAVTERMAEWHEPRWR